MFRRISSLTLNAKIFFISWDIQKLQRASRPTCTPNRTSYLLLRDGLRGMYQLIWYVTSAGVLDSVYILIFTTDTADDHRLTQTFPRTTRPGKYSNAIRA